MNEYQLLLRELPAVDRLLQEKMIKEVLGRLPRRLVLTAVQETIENCRTDILTIKDNPAKLKALNLSVEDLATRAVTLAEKRAASSLKPLINATGIVIHTNLGRAPLSAPAVEALTGIASNYNNLELSLESGERGSRQEHLES